MATENPVGARREPTHSQKAQLDRFMVKALVGYNTIDEEIEIINRVAVKGFEEVKSVASVEDLKEIREQFKKIHVDDDIKRYIAEIIFATRFPKSMELVK